MHPFSCLLSIKLKFLIKGRVFLALNLILMHALIHPANFNIYEQDTFHIQLG